MARLIVVTGGAGFIGSALVWTLNRLGYDRILVVDSLGQSDKWRNLVGLRFDDYREKDDFLEDIRNGTVRQREVQAVFHLGACSSTIHPDKRYYLKNNFEYSKELATFALGGGVRFVYASSAATYGDGSQGFSDDESRLDALRPLNMYGYSKHLFDLWLRRRGVLSRAVGLKYFNVFGPNEYHKGEMRSFVYKAFFQIRETGGVRLFRSHHPDYPDGGQTRDFIYVKDAAAITAFFLNPRIPGGLYNVGTGEPHTFSDLVRAVFDALGTPPRIEYVDTPPAIRSQYQYFTRADIRRLRAVGYTAPLRDFGGAVREYVTEYLVPGLHLGTADR